MKPAWGAAVVGITLALPTAASAVTGVDPDMRPGGGGGLRARLGTRAEGAMIRGSVLAAVLAIPCAAAQALAAETPYDGSPNTNPNGFYVLESTYGAHSDARRGPRAVGWTSSWQFGYLDNVDERNAWGGSLKVSVDGDGHLVGPVLRYRRWLGDDVGLDVGTGLYLGGSEDRNRLQFPAPTVDVGVTLDDWAGCMSAST